jgi:hypothetical protein
MLKLLITIHVIRNNFPGEGSFDSVGPGVDGDIYKARSFVGILRFGLIGRS